MAKFYVITEQSAEMHHITVAEPIALFSDQHIAEEVEDQLLKAKPFNYYRIEELYLNRLPEGLSLPLEYCQRCGAKHGH